MSGCSDRYRALIDADRQWFASYPRRQHRTRLVLMDEVAAMPPHGPVPEQQYCAVLRRVHGAMQKLIFAAGDEDTEQVGAIDAGLSERRAARLGVFPEQYARARVMGSYAELTNPISKKRDSSESDMSRAAH